MHEKVSFHLDGIMIDVPTSVISNSLDYAKLKFLPPLNFNGNDRKMDTLTPKIHQVHMNEVTLKNVLAAHER